MISNSEENGINPLGNGGRIVNTLAIDSSGTLYAGGYDLSNLGRFDDFVVRLEGDSWSSVGEGWGSLAWALATDQNGNLYAGGYVGEAPPLPHVIKWDGESWSALGQGLNSDPGVLAVDGAGHVYAGGGFDSAGTSAARGIAMWDGETWLALGQGIEGGTVREFAVDKQDNLYVGGHFTSAGGVEVNNIAMWDGESWLPLGEGLNGNVSALVANEKNELFAGGRFDSTGGTAISSIAKWDGISWSSFGHALVGGVSALAIDSQGRLYAAGDFEIAGGIENVRVAMWDGTRWIALSEPPGSGIHGGVTSFTADENGTLYAGGNFAFAGDIAANNVARWDGTSWTPLGNGLTGPILDGWVSSLVHGENEDLFVGGQFDTAGDVAAQNIAKWNGMNWSALAEGLNGNAEALALDGNGNLYVGGRFDSAGTVSAGNIAKWNGTSWSALGDGIDGSRPVVNVLAVDADDNLYAAGEFETAGGEPVKNIAMWNGNTWSEVGGGLYDRSTGGRVEALTFGGDGKLYAGGHFAEAGDKLVYHAARWDGVSWEGLGIGFNTTVLSLVMDENGHLYAGGQFTALGPSATVGGYNHIARWDGNDWLPLGSGMERDVHALALDGRGNLYAGGFFSIAGNKPSVAIARWDIQAAISSSVDPFVDNRMPYIFTPAYPNPFRQHTTLEITVNEPQHLVISVYDASGRQISELFDGLLFSHQVHRILLDGTGLASGTYFIRALGETFSQTRIVTFIK